VREDGEDKKRQCYWNESIFSCGLRTESEAQYRENVPHARTRNRKNKETWSISCVFVLWQAH
jgi:hypothetical protein